MTEARDPKPQPTYEVLPGVHLVMPPDGEIETVFVLTKVRFEDGTSAWSWQSPGITNQEELLGALIMQVEVLTSSMLDDWE